MSEANIALEVGDVDAALSFYGQIFSFELRGRSKGKPSLIWAINS
jgi:predicted enzyme related to lactoylglutathione lyase